MNILIANCHTGNRGDEAANRALIDELNRRYKNLHITLAIRGKPYPNLPENVKVIQQYSPLSAKRRIEFFLMRISFYKIILTKTARIFVEEAKKADLVLHSPGGPSIGDIYYTDEMSYLRTYLMINDLKKPYIFFAPSMGPFANKKRYKLRKKILERSKAVIVRDPISRNYILQSFPEIDVHLALDSAFQFDFDFNKYNDLLEKSGDLLSFIKTHKKIVGLTITELDWHPIYSKDILIKNNIKNVMSSFIEFLVNEGCGILFIPQLYGESNDYNLMKTYFKSENCYILEDNNPNYDSYFQQFIISKLYCVIGMRYHSNIFSAKVGTPFISISYEQKMRGFMEINGLENFCIDVDRLTSEILLLKFKELCENYELYKKKLLEKHDNLKNQSLRTMDIVDKYINGLNK